MNLSRLGDERASSLAALACLFAACVLLSPSLTPRGTADAFINLNKNFQVVKKDLITRDGPAEFSPGQTLFLGAVALSLLAGKFLGFLPLNVNRVAARIVAAARGGAVAPFLGGGGDGGGAANSTVVAASNVTESTTTTSPKSSATAAARSLVLDYDYSDIWGHATALVSSDPTSCFTLLMCDVERANEKYSALNEEFNKEENGVLDDGVDDEMAPYPNGRCSEARERCHFRFGRMAEFVRDQMNNFG